MEEKNAHLVFGNIFRRYILDSVKSMEPFIGHINNMSFHISNTGLPNMRLRKEIPEGTIIVKRYGDRENVYIRGVGGYLFNIILSSAKDETYIIPFSIEKCTVSKKSNEVPLANATFSKGTLPDEFTEVCPFIFTLDQVFFNIVITGSNDYCPVVRDDWHNIRYTLNSNNEATANYYEACTLFSVHDPVALSWSFSPYTYLSSVKCMHRYIDQWRRLYVPVLDSKDIRFTGYMGFPYGKKPFTIMDKEISTFREVVKIDKMVQITFTSNIFWPFIPYMQEVPYLNLLMAMKWVDAFWSHKIKYSIINGTVITDYNNSLRTDEVIFTPPYVNTVSVAVWNKSFSTCNNMARTESTKKDAVDFTKFATIGTVGNLKDLFIKTKLSVISGSTSINGFTVVRDANMPDQYYTPEFVDDLFWPCGAHYDATNCRSEISAISYTKITGVQTLQIGDFIIGSGNISMEYDGSDSNIVTHNGSATQNKPCGAGCSGEKISVTLSQMGIGTNQTLSIIGAIGGETYSWAIVSGSGTLSNQTFDTIKYTAPGDNANCLNNPTIQLSVGSHVCDSVTIAVYASVSGYAYTHYGNFQCNENVPSYPNWRYCYVDNQSFGCNGVQIGYQTSSYDDHTSPYPPVDCAHCQSVSGFGALLLLPPVDVRTSQQKLDGCCPASLIGY